MCIFVGAPACVQWFFLLCFYCPLFFNCCNLRFTVGLFLGAFDFWLSTLRTHLRVNEMLVLSRKINSLISPCSRSASCLAHEIPSRELPCTLCHGLLFLRRLMTHFQQKGSHTWFFKSGRVLASESRRLHMTWFHWVSLRLLLYHQYCSSLFCPWIISVLSILFLVATFVFWGWNLQ